jgi:hypothetical protein
MADLSANSGNLFFHEFREALEFGKDSIELVYFDSCQSLSMADSTVDFLPCALGFETAVGCCDSRSFAVQFYSSLSRRRSIGDAYAAAKAHMKLLGGNGKVPLLRTSVDYVKKLSYFKG